MQMHGVLAGREGCLAMIDKDADGKPIRARHLSPDELRLAYQVPPLSDVFARLADTRLAMLREQQKRERATKEEFHDVG